MGLIRVSTGEGEGKKILKLFHNVRQTAEYFSEKGIRGFSLRTLRTYDLTGPFTKGIYTLQDIAPRYTARNTDKEYNRMQETRALIPGPRGVIKQVIKQNRRRTEHKVTRRNNNPEKLLMSVQKMIFDKIPERKRDRVKIQVVFEYYDPERNDRTIQTRYMNINEILKETQDLITYMLYAYDAPNFIFHAIKLNYYIMPNLEDVIIFKNFETFNYKNKYDLISDLMKYEHIEHYDIIKNCLNVICPTTYKKCYLTCFIMHAEKREDVKKKLNSDWSIYDRLTHTIKDTPEILTHLYKHYDTLFNADIYFYTGGKIEKRHYTICDTPEQKQQTISIFIYAGHSYLINNDNTFIINDLEQHKPKQEYILKPKQANTNIKYIVYCWDLETTNDEEGNATPYALGLYTNGDYEEFYKKNDTHNIIKSFINYLDTLTHNAILYAHNGGRFDTRIILKDLLTTKKINNYLENDNNIIKLDFYNKKGFNISFRDSKNFLEGSLNDLCKSYDTKTKKLNDTVKHDLINLKNCCLNSKILIEDKKIYDYTKEYLKNDCISLYEIITTFKDIIYKEHNLNIDNILTNAGIARNIFFKNYYNPIKTPIYNISVNLENHIRNFYFGGRNEIFNKLGHTKQKLFYYDFVSLYGYLMSKYFYPVGQMNILIIEEKDKKIFNPRWFGLVECKFKHTKFNKKPFHALKDTNNNLVFGYVREYKTGIFTTDEINYSIKKKLGYTYIYDKIYNYEKKERIFKEVIRNTYKLKERATKQNNKALTHSAKIILNSFSGFWGQKTQRTQNIIINNDIEADITEEEKALKIEKNKNNKFNAFLMSDKLISNEEISGHSIYKIEGEIKEPLSNIIISFFITAQGRQKIYDTINNIEEQGGTVYYTDTDSIITNLNINENEELTHKYNVNSLKLGSLTNEATKIYKTLLKQDNISDKEINKFIDNNECFEELITTANKFYSLRVNFNYNDKNYKYDLMKTRGINSNNKYDIREIDHETKTIFYKNLNSKGQYVFNRSDYIKLSQGYKIVVEELKFNVKKYDINIKTGTRKITSFYTKGQINEQGIITPLMF
jgi:hypothetical protein